MAKIYLIFYGLNRNALSSPSVVRTASSGRSDTVNAFEINGTYYLRHFFEPDELFDELRYYYNNQQHRFEVPSSAFPALRTLLRGHNYTVVVVRDIEPYVIAVRKYTPHPGNVFTTSVYQWSVREHNCFLLRDETAIEAAVS